ncbi:uncharacterized protein EDB91DRAFT_1123349 [Suillus paluster]|uniref:uncharacterized protein n=1 Tax=Suillus paluster TaxID=48578 RepID=UPI001B882B16|nr:uncharacterized protein EDB91DRAFT_1123349 [Suillus paluster]KAG1744604.1 hypothetical protein EDB91DRAFT_1123349 [Suillus paluster]
MDDSSQPASKDIPFQKPLDTQKEKFSGMKGDKEPIVGELEEEEILNSEEVALEGFVANLNFTLVSAILYMVICWTHMLGQDCPVGPATHERQTLPPPQCALLHRILFVCGLLSLCVAFPIVLGKILMGQYKIKVRLPFYGPPLRLPKSQRQFLRGISASMPTWFMQILKSLSLVFPAVQFVMTVVLLVARFYLTG